jgi:hypothetical protein
MNYEVSRKEKYSMQAGRIRYTERYNVPERDPNADGSRTERNQGGSATKIELCD